MEIALINRHNFTRESLDAFSRYQVVKNVYRVKEGEMYLAYRPFVETWTLERKREKAAEILAGDHIVYGKHSCSTCRVGDCLRRGGSAGKVCRKIF